MDQSFPRQEKLKSKKLIESVFGEGSSVSKYPIKLVYIATDLPEEVRIQVAVSVPKRRFKKAVDRNRIKRLLRECWRLEKSLWVQNTDQTYAFMFIYTGKELPEFKELQKKMRALREKFLENVNN